MWELHDNNSSSSPPSHIVSPGVGALSHWPGCSGVCYTTLRGHAVPCGLLFLWRATAAENGPSNQQQACSGPAQIQRCPDLHLLSSGDDRTVELNHDGVGWPGDGHNLCQSCCDERCPRSNHHLGFDALVIDAVGALGSHHGDEQSHHTHYDGDDSEGPGGLQVLRQSQHGVVDLTLHLARALEHAAHPQALPVHLSRHDVGADEGRHSPHWQSAADNTQRPAEHWQGDTDHFKSKRNHCSLRQACPLSIKSSFLSSWFLLIECPPPPQCSSSSFPTCALQAPGSQPSFPPATTPPQGKHLLLNPDQCCLVSGFHTNSFLRVCARSDVVSSVPLLLSRQWPLSFYY